MSTPQYSNSRLYTPNTSENDIRTPVQFLNGEKLGELKMYRWEIIGVLSARSCSTSSILPKRSRECIPFYENWVPQSEQGCKIKINFFPEKIFLI